jgi:hypothetical protein
MTNAAVADNETVAQPGPPASPTDPPPNGAPPADTQPQANTAPPAPAAPTGEAPPAPADAPPPPADPPAPPAPPALTEEELERRALEKREAREAEALRIRQAAELEEEVRTLRADPSKEARRVLDTIAEQAGVVIPVALREQLENWATNLATKSEQMGVQSVGDRIEAAAREEQQSFKDACYAAAGQSRRAEFIAKVNGQDHEFWVKTANEFAAENAGMLTTSALVDEAKAFVEDAASTLSADEQATLAKALEGKKTAKDIIATVAKAMLEKGQRGPGAAPPARDTSGGAAFSSYRQYAVAYNLGEIPRSEYYAAKDRYERGQLPA